MTSQMTDEKLELITIALEKIARTIEELSTAVRFLYEMKIQEREQEMRARNVTPMRPPYPARNQRDYRDFPDVRKHELPRQLSTDPRD